MIEILAKAEQFLSDFLRTPDDWESVRIDYEQPVVERLWRQWGTYRILLHVAQPCLPSTAFFHPHPWPSAVHLLSGGPYEMVIGFDAEAARLHHLGEPHQPPSYASKIIVGPGLQYEMTDPGAWHYVCPTKTEVFSVMVTGPAWIEHRAPRSKKELEPIMPGRKTEIISMFQELARSMMVL